MKTITRITLAVLLAAIALANEHEHFQPHHGDHDPPGIPEPSTIILMGTGIVGLALLARHRARK